MRNYFKFIIVLGIYLSALRPIVVYAQSDSGPAADTSGIPVGHEPKDDKGGSTRDGGGAGEPDKEPLDPTKEESESKVMSGKSVSKKQVKKGYRK